jgi:sec-independent protein translocase protein TatB
VFELGFSEVLLILIIGLVVIGPERLPEVARGIGSMVGKVKRFIDNVRSETDLHGEIAALRQQLDLSKEAAQLQNLGSVLKNDIQSSVAEIDASFYDRPSTEEIRRQHREAEAHNAAQNTATPTPDEPDLVEIQRPTFGREAYEELPPYYHQQSDGVMLSKAPNIPEPPPTPLASDSSAPVVAEAANTASTAKQA